MSKLILLLGAAVVAGGLFYVFAQWERSAREHWVVFFILGMLIVEASLYGNYNDVPRGIFHPGTGSFQFRLPEVVISVALLARLAVKGWPLRIGFPALAWTVVAAWWTLEMVEGLLRHNSTVYLPYEAKAIIYVMGGIRAGVGGAGAPFSRRPRLRTHGALVGADRHGSDHHDDGQGLVQRAPAPCSAQ